MSSLSFSANLVLTFGGYVPSSTARIRRAVACTIRGGRYHRKDLLRGYLLAVLGALSLAGLPAWASSIATSTALAVTSGGSSVSTVTSGSVVTLTATVKAGSKTVTVGQVNFCDATAKSCTDIHLLGTAQLTKTGTAVIRIRPGIGSHNYMAVFLGTPNGALNAAASTSGTAALTVTGLYPSEIAIGVPGGDVGNYTLAATVTGNASSPPTGNISFLDANNNDAVLGTATLNAGAAGLSFFSRYPAINRIAAASAIAVGDFNGDGIPDLAGLYYCDPGCPGDNLSPGSTVTVMLGNGDGTFKAPINSPSPASTPGSIAVGDFNGDGIPDLAFANYLSGTVTVMLGNGDGTFASTPVSPAAGSEPYSIAVDDFNGDGIPDLAVANLGSNTVTVLLGNGDGTFASTSVSPVTGSGLSSIAIGDFNGDGIPDLAVAKHMVVANLWSNTVTVLLGNGDGTFASKFVSPATDGSASPLIAVGDFNRDGIPDLAIIDTGRNSTVSVLLGIGDGTFTLTSTISIPVLNPYPIAVGDFNGDGIPDLAVSSASGDYLDERCTILLGNGDGTFTATSGTGEYGLIAASDFNGDGISDLIQTMGVFHGSPPLWSVSLSNTQAATGTATGIALPVAMGTQQVVASYTGDSSYGSSISSAISLAPAKGTPSVTVTALPQSAAYGTSVTLTAKVTGSGLTPTGTVQFSDQNGPLGTGTLDSGAVATFATNALSAGSHAITVSYSGDSNYNAAISAELLLPVSSGFKVSGTAVTVSPGATTGNTSTITVTAGGDFTGSVVLTAAVTSSPAGAKYLPTLSFGATNQVSVSSTTAGTATLTISTTAATSAALAHPRHPGMPWYATGSAALACMLLFGIPTWRRRWRTMLGMLALLVTLTGGVLSCGGGSSNGGGGGSTGIPGTTPGAYTVTVTGTSGSTAAICTVALTVQ
ncbi:MAG: FG-GAP-like repeat-containing protein [Terracidiphilus sp.]|nr:FG-GAP-like repeat-containing protein [Terracidiphilus sp.]